MENKIKLKFFISVLRVVVLISALITIAAPYKKFTVYIMLIPLGILNIIHGYTESKNNSKAETKLLFSAGLFVLIVGIIGIALVGFSVI